MPMQSRTDQVHSYQFFLRRMVSALVAKESDPAEVPFRRLGWAGFGSIMLAVLVVAGFGIYGLLVGGAATSWQDGQSVVVDKDSGTAYVYRAGRLHPMVNLVSAQLALGTDQVVRVSPRSLRDVPRGPVLGIRGAPAGLPGNDRLLGGGWSLCSEAVPDGHGGRIEQSVLAVGRSPAGGTPLATGQAVLVRDASGTEPDLHLVWRGHRFVLAVADTALPVLGLARERALPVAPAWLESLPAGEPIQYPAADEPGGPTAAFGEVRQDLDLRTGQVIQAADTYYLVRSAELVELTSLQAELALSTPGVAGSSSQARTDIPPAALANATIQPRPEPTVTTPPAEVPELAAMAPEELRDGVVCAVFTPDVFTPEIRPGARLPGWPAQALATGRQTAQGHRLVDFVLVPGGAAALVQAAPAPEAAAGAVLLVTDLGFRHALAEPGVAGWLGYDLDRAVRLPAGLVALLPDGPALDPAAAVQPAGPA